MPHPYGFSGHCLHMHTVCSPFVGCVPQSCATIGSFLTRCPVAASLVCYGCAGSLLAVRAEAVCTAS